MGRIVTLTGPSGAGKTTIASELLRRIPNARMIASVTTRERRSSDLPGEYEYLSPKLHSLFFDHPESFLWTARHAGNQYGTTKVSVNEVLDSRDIGGSQHELLGIMILVPSVLRQLQGYVFARSVTRSAFVPIFVIPPEKDIVIQRLRDRGDTEGSIEQRMLSEVNWVPEAIANRSLLGLHFEQNDSDIESIVTRVVRWIELTATAAS